MSQIGVDLNATRIRACHAAAGGPAPLALEGNDAELPLAVSLEARTPAVGRAGVAVCRKLPHLACVDFLPHLGGNKQWTAGRHRLDAAAALGLVCQYLQPRFARASGVVLSLPAYLDEVGAGLVDQVARKAGWKVLGAVPAPLAAALAAREFLPWSGLAVVVEADDHAVTFSAVTLEGERARLASVRPCPKLALGLWLRALIDGVARRCVRMSRRDPRASADTEQSLYEQLLALLGPAPPAREGMVELNIQSAQWFQNVMLPAEELAGYTAALTELAQTELLQFVAGLGALGPVGVMILTSAAGRLPGLAAALDRYAPAPAAQPERPGSSDFGEGLLGDEQLSAAAHAIDPDALARAALDLAPRFQSRELAAGWHTELGIPGLEARAGADVECGPARIHFAGQDHVLKKPTFTLGRHPACDLVFPTELYPSVSARHCEIVRDQRGHLLRDRSRHGTLLNDRPVQGQAALSPGDWIRLGPDGPLLRFLGSEPAGPLQLVTTA